MFASGCYFKGKEFENMQDCCCSRNPPVRSSLSEFYSMNQELSFETYKDFKDCFGH